MFSIWKSSTELSDASEPWWLFPAALSSEAHAEWGLYKILEYMGLHEILQPGAGQNRAQLQKDIEEYHIACGIDFDDTDIDTFIAWSSALSPEAHAEWGLYKILEHMGLHDKETKSCVFLEYTRSMDTNEDWAEKKEQEKKWQI